MTSLTKFCLMRLRWGPLGYDQLDEILLHEAKVGPLDLFTSSINIRVRRVIILGMKRS